MIKIKKAKDKNLLVFEIIILLNAIIMFVGGNLLYLKYILLIINIFFIFMQKEDKYLPTILFMHPNSALYDDIGFKYIFNITIFILVIKMIISKRYFLHKKITLLFLIIIFWEILLVLKSSLIDLSILSMISWISGYLMVIFMINKTDKLNFNSMFEYFFRGFILSVIAGLATPISKWGIDFPIAYRFTGLLRDPNYYSVDAIILIFSSFDYSKSRKDKFNIYALVIFILGILSVSKMFILITIVGFILIFFKKIIEKRSINKQQFIINTIVCTIVCIVGIYTLIRTNAINIIIDKYLYRTDTTSLFTGRDYIQKYYLEQLINKPSNFWLGNSMLKYSKVLDIGETQGKEFFKGMVAHNTYLDLILSWGFFGTVVYAIFIISIIKVYKTQIVKENKVPFITNSNILIVLMLTLLLSLSYLMVDVFAIQILYIIIFKYKTIGELDEKTN